MAEEIIDNGLKNKLLEIWGSEATIYYPGKYAGTADCIGVYEGKESILDLNKAINQKRGIHRGLLFTNRSLFFSS